MSSSPVQTAKKFRNIQIHIIMVFYYLFGNKLVTKLSFLKAKNFPACLNAWPGVGFVKRVCFKMYSKLVRLFEF